jgi:hypothetical protein
MQTGILNYLHRSNRAIVSFPSVDDLTSTEMQQI